MGGGWGHRAPTRILRITGTEKQKQNRGKRKQIYCRRRRVTGETFVATLSVDAMSLGGMEEQKKELYASSEQSSPQTLLAIATS